MILVKDVLLIWCSIQKSFSGRLNWFLYWKIYFENWKCQISDKSASNCLTRYQKILWDGSLGCKKLLKFTCLTMRFHNRHHTSVHILLQPMYVGYLGYYLLISIAIDVYQQSLITIMVSRWPTSLGRGISFSFLMFVYQFLLSQNRWRHLLTKFRTKIVLNMWNNSVKIS